MPILTPEERLGQRIAGRYHLDDVLSSGGMGVLFRATDGDTGEQVAVKMINPMHALNPGHVARFVREMRIASTIRHPNIVRVLDAASDDAGVPFLIMELLHGRSLAQELERRTTLPFAEVLAIAVPIASALEAAHALGIVHRDLKPSNIFLCDEPSTGGTVPKLLDFGIAKSVQDDFETDTGFLIGTPGYMAPEHAQYGECCPSTDIWGLGAVIHCCLAGHAPHAGGSVHEMLGKLVREPVPALEVAGLTKRASAIIDRALARDPQLRYPTVAAFRHALNALAGSDASAPPDETAAFQAADLDLPAHPAAPVKDVPLAPPENAKSATPAPRGRRRMFAAACVTAVSWSAMAFVPVSAELHAPERVAAPSIDAQRAPVRQAATVSATLVSTAEPLLVTKDAMESSSIASALPSPEPLQPHKIMRRRRSRADLPKRDEPEQVAKAAPARFVGPDPMDRRH
jgi:serine/threonine-protein kinase